MAFDLEKIKKNLASGKLGNMFPKKGQDMPVWAKQSPKLEELKAGLRDIKNVLAEGKFSLFVKQFVVLAGVFLLVRTVNGKLNAHNAELKDKMSAITIQQTNKGEYLSNKDHLLRLEPLFPDIEQKSDWLPSKLMALFSKHDLSPKLDGNFSENAKGNLTIVSQPISWQQSYKKLGEMMADLENGEDFLRVSEVSIAKLTGKEELGDNTVTVRFNTVFPKEKYAQKLFKDYKQQMEKINAEKQAVTTSATSTVSANTQTEETK